MRRPHMYRRLAAEEPFRVFFPMGMTFGVIGIALWPLHFSGLLTDYPLLAHTRFMVHGFLSCFVIGFLLTAGPRLLKCPPPSPFIVSGFLLMALSNALALLCGSWSLADAIFLGEILALIALAALGFGMRRHLPPPGFFLAATGIGCAFTGAILMSRVSSGIASAEDYALAKILLFQAFPLLPLIGIGSFFFPKLSGGAKQQHDLPFDRRPSRDWLKRAGRAALASLAFIASIPLELSGNLAAAYTLRALAIALYLLLETPIFRRNGSPGRQSLHLIVCSLAMIASLGAIAIFPAQRGALLHGFFITALTGSIILVSTRVVLGHSGKLQLAMRSAKPLFLAIVALLLAAATRIFADFWPDERIAHYLYSASIWLLVALAWLVLIAPNVRHADPDDG